MQSGQEETEWLGRVRVARALSPPHLVVTVVRCGFEHAESSGQR